MIRFVNAKINIGLNVVAKREDGYHDLETVFYPVGLECGLPHQPGPFDDVLEVTYDSGEMSGCRFQFVGRRIDCPPKKNLVVRAASLFLGKYNERLSDLNKFGMFQITLDKHLPDGAGLGGGSADAAFTLASLNEITGNHFSESELSGMAVKLGADCPFFLINSPCFASGIGEDLNKMDLDLHEYVILIIKPDVYVSTAEAFADVTPHKPDFDLRFLPFLPIEEWKEKVVNDFEPSVFSRHPELSEIKSRLYDSGALYASMSGSGSAIYGIYRDKDLAFKERDRIESTYPGVWLFGL
ncbi:MAG: 4-(cytidine 5'-diphospho)-2-C-methyl-D-erythritol kinase [Muribaculaceae bacterium]|nr:4-(cytidine 5'-diphospho)-2-C-methyl-D-erythritol kinase [Muribaculaceae bacterium]